MPANYLVALILIREEARKRHNYRINLKYLRDTSNPFELTQAKFKKLFRISKPAVQFLIAKLETKSRQTDIPFQLKILCALHFYGHGSYQVSIGSCEKIAFSQPSVSRAIKEMTKLIVKYIMNDFIKFPQTVLEQAEVKNKFVEKFQMPGVIGAIDGCHVTIAAPSEQDEFNRGNLFRNRKGNRSINVLVCCDANMRILYANARFPGSVHDSAIWMTSKLRAYCVQNFNSVHNQSNFLLGDSGFPLEPWLLTNYARTENGTSQYRFNNSFIRARNIIEKCFGVMKSRFRCLLKHRTLHYKPDMAYKIIYAVCTLHNIQIDINNGDDSDSDSDDSDSDNEDAADDSLNGNINAENIPNDSGTDIESANHSWYMLGSRMRELYVNSHFIN